MQSVLIYFFEISKIHGYIAQTNKEKLQMILMLNTMKIQIKKILNSNLVIMLEFQDTKTFLLKDTFQIGQKKFLLLVKLRMQFLGLM